MLCCLMWGHRFENCIVHFIFVLYFFVVTTCTTQLVKIPSLFLDYNFDSYYALLLSCGHKFWLLMYCCRSGSGPPWLVGHSILFCWMKALSSKILCSMDASMVDKYPLKSWTRGMWWPFPKIRPIIKINPKVAVSLFTLMCRFDSLLDTTEGL